MHRVPSMVLGVGCKVQDPGSGMQGPGWRVEDATSMVRHAWWRVRRSYCIQSRECKSSDCSAQDAASRVEGAASRVTHPGRTV